MTAFPHPYHNCGVQIWQKSVHRRPKRFHAHAVVQMKWKQSLVLCGLRLQFHFETGARYNVDYGFHFIWKPASAFMYTPVSEENGYCYQIHLGDGFQNNWILASNLFGSRFQTFLNGWRLPKHSPHRSTNDRRPKNGITPESSMGRRVASK